MEYRLAKPEEKKDIYKIVQDTIKKIYPKYYLTEIINMFSKFHNEQNISEDIEMETLTFFWKRIESLEQEP